MKEIIMTIGLPYSGKSTLAKKYVEQGYFLIERDKLIKEIVASSEFDEQVKALITPDIAENKKKIFDIKNEVATKMLNARIEAIVEREKPEKIIYDGTNLQRATRKGVLDLKKFGYKIKAIALPLDEQTFIERHLKTLTAGERQGDFNERAHLLINQFIAMTENPTTDEGFDSVEVIAPTNLNLEIRSIK